MSKKPWNEIDLNAVHALESEARILNTTAEQLKFIALKIRSKYQLPEAEQPHNLCR